MDTTSTNPRGIFKEMCFNEKSEDSILLNKSIFAIYYEYTLKPSRDASIQSISNGSDLHFASNLLINKSKIDQFKLSSPISTSKNEFLKGVISLLGS